MQNAERRDIESELQALVNSFSYFIDHSRYEELSQLFTEDGVFDRIGQQLVGPASVLHAMRKRHAFLTRHCVTNLMFRRIDADEAEATMYVINMVGEPEAQGLPVKHAMQPALLEFDDVYRRTAQGWRIARRTARLIIKADAAGH